MEIIEKTIRIKKPNMLNKTKINFKDWCEYNQEYVKPLDNQLAKIASETFDYFCKRENKLVGRNSWLGHRKSIKPEKKQYFYNFWEMENIREISFSLHSTRGKNIGKLIVNIEWI